MSKRFLSPTLLLAAAALAATVAAVFSLAAAASSQAAAVSSRTPFAFGWVNPCTEEVVFLEGTIHLVSRGGEPPFVGPHGFHFSVQARGISNTGMKYVLVDVQNVQTTFPEAAFPGQEPPPERPAADIYTAVVRIQLIRQGSESPADDQRYFVDAHITENANGEITVLRLDVDERCQ